MDNPEIVEPPGKARPERSRSTGRVGIRDVARDAGVSVATVSRTLAGTGYPISKEAREKVLRSVAKLGFVPNDAARSLSQDRSNAIGVIVPNVVNLYYANVVMGLEEVAAQHGLSVIVCNTRYDQQKFESDFRVLLQKRVDGIVFCGNAPELNPKSIKAALRDVPFIVVGRNDRLEYPSVQADNYKAGYQAAQHLIDIGHRTFAFLGGPDFWDDGVDRVQGFKACLRHHDIPEANLHLSHGPTSEEDGYKRTFAMGRTDITAVVGGNDRLAIGAMAALIDLGLSVPDEVAVMGFDNVATGTFVRPSLTTMDIPTKKMGAEALRLILKLQNSETVPSRVVFEAPLLVRGSTAVAEIAAGRPAGTRD